MACSLVPAAFRTHLISDGGVNSTALLSSSAAWAGRAASRTARTAMEESRAMPLMPSPVEGGSVRRDLLPALVRVEALDLLHQRRRAGTEILLVDDAVLAHDEGHHAGGAPLRGEGDEGEPADHVAVRDVVRGSSGGIRTLGREDAVVVAVKGRAPVRAAVPLRPRPRDERSERTLRLPRLALPVETILLARRPGQPLGVLVHLGLLPLPRSE